MTERVHELDFSKQSKWVQRAVEYMQREIKELRRSVDALSNLHPGSNVVLRGRNHDDPDIGLPPDSTVYFYAGEGRERLTNMIEVRHDHDNPERIYIASYGTRGLHIITSSSNSFYLELEKRLWACG